MEERTPKEDEVTILDKNETSDRAVSVVGGFVIEESVTPFPVRRKSSVWEGRDLYTWLHVHNVLHVYYMCSNDLLHFLSSDFDFSIN